MKPIKLVYWLLIAILGLELYQIGAKTFTPFYFNLVRMGMVSVVMMYMGWKLGISKIFVIVFGVISLSLIVSAYILVWN